jgi:hypothetical protein
VEEVTCQQNGEFAQLSGQCEKPRFDVSGKVTDSQNAYTVLSGVTLTFKSSDGTTVATTTTDYRGLYHVLLPQGAIKAEAAKNGYINRQADLVVESAMYVGQGADMSLSKVLPEGEWRVVLEWAGLPESPRNPTDLDSHIKFVSSNRNYGTYYQREVYYPYKGRTVTDYSTGLAITLDRDDVDGFGPETTTLGGIGKCTLGRDRCLVQFYVKNYAMDGPLGESRAVVTVYAGQSILAKFPIPASAGNERTRVIFTIDASAGKIFDGSKEVGPHLSPGEQHQSWRTSFDNERWSKVPATSVVSGITASKIGPIHTIDYGLYHDIMNPGTISCSDYPIAIDAVPGWNACPEGHFLNGFFRTGTRDYSSIAHITQARCCRAERLPEKHGKCVEVASFQSLPAEARCPLVSVDGVDTPTALVGIHHLGGDGATIESLDQVRCCAFPQVE